MFALTTTFGRDVASGLILLRVAGVVAIGGLVTNVRGLVSVDVLVDTLTGDAHRDNVSMYFTHSLRWVSDGLSSPLKRKDNGLNGTGDPVERGMLRADNFVVGDLGIAAVAAVDAVAAAVVAVGSMWSAM